MQLAIDPVALARILLSAAHVTLHLPCKCDCGCEISLSYRGSCGMCREGLHHQPVTLTALETVHADIP